MVGLAFKSSIQKKCS